MDIHIYEMQKCITLIYSKTIATVFWKWEAIEWEIIDHGGAFYAFYIFVICW